MSDRTGEQGPLDSKRNQFIAVLAHELRNPIAPIKSGLDLLANGHLDGSKQGETVAMMRRQLSHLVRIVDDLLDAARLNAGKMRVELTPVLLADVIQASIESVGPAIEAKDQRLTIDNANADTRVNADPVRLSQAFSNILNSCSRNAPHGSRITLSAATTETDVIVTIEDERNMPAREPSERGFEALSLSLGDQSDSDLGIGLALVQGLLALQSGRIDMAPRGDAEGTMFTVQLPLIAAAGTPEPEVAAALQGEAPPPAQWRSHRILVVDDNKDAANTLGLLLELDGHTVRIVHDGLAAVAEADEFQPEAIFMDMGLPGLNGTEATRQIRQKPASIRPFIVALTGWGSQADMDASAAAGCDAHLVKPIDYEQALTTLRLIG